MKKTVIFIIIALMVFNLSACKDTPDKPIVQSKDLDTMIENATREQTDSTAQGATIVDKLDTQETYIKELTDAKGKVVINVNAQVSIPDVENVSVIRVERGVFSQDTVDIVREWLVKGELFKGNTGFTKAEIQAEITALETMLAEGLPPTNGRLSEEMVESQIEALKKQLEAAPEEYAKTPISGMLEDFEDNAYSAGERLLGFAQSEQGGYESFTVYNDYRSSVNLMLYTSEKNGFAPNMGYYISKEASGANSYPSADVIDAIPDISLTKEDALGQADALIAALGIDYLTCYTIEKVYGGSDDIINPRKCVWFLRYVREVNGIPVTHTPYDCMKTETDAQSAPWSYEDMTFVIDDSGIVGFRWSSPYEFTEVVTDNSNLLSFADIADVFDTMSLVVNAWDGISANNPRLTGVEIIVDEIRFGMTRITEQDKRDSGLLIPVWDFFGTMTYIMEVDGQVKRMDVDYVPILTINAIDGSIINRSLGY